MSRYGWSYEAHSGIGGSEKAHRLAYCHARVGQELAAVSEFSVGRWLNTGGWDPCELLAV